MKHSYIILGGKGRVGRVVHRQLDKLDPGCEVHIWDLDTSKPTRPNGKVIISCADTSVDFVLVDEACKPNTDKPRAIITLGGDDAVTEKIIGLDNKLKKRGITTIYDSGLAPGLPQAIASLGYQKGYKYVDIGCGGVPAQPLATPYHYLLSFSAKGLYRELTGPCKQIIDKKVGYVPALWGADMILYPPGYSMLEGRPTSAGLSDAPEYFQDKLWGLTYSTFRHPEHWELLLKNILLQPAPAELMDKVFTPVGPDNHDLIILHYRFRYGPEEAIERTLFCKYDKENETSALCLATGCVAAQTAVLAWDQKPGIVGMYKLDPEILINSVPWIEEV